MRAIALQIAKWSWVVVVCAAGAVYAAHHRAELITQLQSVPGVRLALSFGLLVLGKLLLVVLSRRSVQVPVWKPSFGEMFFISGMTQVAKYLPGGVWHFVGRAGAYRSKGMSLQETGRALFVENVWLCVSALGTGLLFFLPFGAPLEVSPWVLEGVLAFVVVCWLSGVWGLDRLHRPGAGARARWSFDLLGVQCLAWLTLGASFWVLLPAASTVQGLLVSAGAFALSWLLGFLMVFAPGGLGVRELGLGVLMSSLYAPEQTMFFAVIHRFVWVSVEMLLAALAAGLSEMKPVRSVVPREGSTPE